MQASKPNLQLCSKFVLLCLSFWALSFQLARAQDMSSSSLEASLKKQSDAWIAAIVNKDRNVIAANMAESFLMIDFDGRKVDKQGFINALTSADLVIEPYALEDVTIRVFGNTALIHASNKMRGTFKGQPFTRYYRYIDIYVKEGDVWRVVAVQTTPVT